MSGAWFALATVAIGVIVRWLILNDTGPSRRKQGGFAETATGAKVGVEKSFGSKKSKRWRAPGTGF
jgi:hypothetical protein